MQRYGAIVGTGIFLPEKEVTNEELKTWVAPELEEVIEKFRESSGIERRWYAPREWAASDLAALAAKEALSSAGVRAEELDLIMVGTDTPDYITPSTSVVVQHKIGAKNAGTFDIGCACASFATGVAVASGMIATNPWVRRVLVVGAYMMSKLADPKDPATFFYGDGAGAVVMAPDSRPGFISSVFFADGSYHGYWGIYSGATYEPATCESVRAGRTRVRIIQRYPPEVNEVNWPRHVRLLAERGGFTVQDIDMAIFTQVRLPTIVKVMEDLGLPLSRTHWIMDKWGYTGSACIPMALHDAIQQGKVRSGDLLVMVGSGVGYNQAGVALRMP